MQERPVYCCQNCNHIFVQPDLQVVGSEHFELKFCPNQVCGMDIMSADIMPEPWVIDRFNDIVRHSFSAPRINNLRKICLEQMGPQS